MLRQRSRGALGRGGVGKAAHASGGMGIKNQQ